MRRLSLWFLAFLIPGLGFGQLSLFNQVEVPENPVVNTWHFNTKTTVLKRYDGKNWLELDLHSVRGIAEWNGLVQISMGDMKTYAHADGKILLKLCHWMRKDEKLFYGFSCGMGTYFLNLAGDTLGCMGVKDFIRQYREEIVAGQRAFCTPKYVPGTKRINADLMHNWGMLSLEGEWLIEPRYDAPFSFENGIATVSYKGKEIQINEKGDLIE